MFRPRDLCFPILLLLYLPSRSQSTLPNSGEILERGTKLHDDGQFKEAIALYQQIPIDDTNYSRVLHELSLSSYQDSDFNSAVRYADSGLLLFPEEASSWLVLRAEALDELGQKDSALADYNRVIRMSPYNYSAWFNRGVTLFSMKRYDSAKASFQRCVLIYPYHASAHFYLGLIEIQEGRPVPSMLSLMMSLIVNPEGRHARAIANLLTSEANVTDEISGLVSNGQSGPEDNFDAEQEIFLSKAALDKKYPLQSDIEDPITRQLQVILDKTTYRMEDKGFWMQYYVPFFKDVFSAGEFNVMLHEMFSGLGIKSVDEWNKHHSSELKAFADQFVAYFKDIAETEQLDYPSRDTAMVKYLFNDDNNLEGIGYFTHEGKKTILSGPWTFYFSTGAIRSRGVLDAHTNKQGEWVFYHRNGQVSEISNYKDDKLNGRSRNWFDNGIQSEDEVWVDDKMEGTFRSWYYNGLPHMVTEYAKGLKNGLSVEYSSDGFLLSDETYQAGQEDGIVKSYYSNGQPSMVTHFIKGNPEGERKKFSRAGVLIEDAWFMYGQETGTWKTYYNNGKIHETYTMEKGAMKGLYTEYYTNGSVKQTQNYVKGLAEGKESDYTEGGRLWEEDLYEKGKIRSVQFYGPDAKPVNASEIKGSGGLLSFYDSLGARLSDANYSFKGDKEGEVTYFYPGGQISGRASFKGGDRDGRRVNYFLSGALSDSTNYSQGQEEGYYVYYYENGRIKQDGWYHKGQRTGPFREFDVLGNLTYSVYFVDGERNGYATSYEPSGRPNFQYLYQQGWPVHFTEWDSAGHKLGERDIPPGDTLFVSHIAEGKAGGEGHYRHYHLDGPYDYFFCDHSLSARKYFRQELKDSTYVSYYFVGKKSVEGTYRLDNQEGIWTYYYENGQVRDREPYQEDALQGERVRYNEDGTLSRKTNYVSDQPEGPTTYYGDSNRVAFILYYHEGDLTGYSYPDKDGNLVPMVALPHGTGALKAWYPNGVVSAEVTFVNGSMDGERTFYFSNGKVQMKGRSIMGKDQGVQLMYYPNGNLAAEEPNYFDNLHGLCKYYYPSGTLKLEENYYNGDLEGIYKSYDPGGHLKQTRVYYYGILEEVY